LELWAAINNGASSQAGIICHISRLNATALIAGPQSWGAIMAYDSTVKRDRALGFHWRSNGLSEALGQDPADRALESLLTEACLAAEGDQSVSYSRRRDFYAGVGRYHGTGWSYRNVLRAVTEAARLGLIRDYHVPPGNHGWQSWFEATDDLTDVWRGRPQALRYDQGDPIVLRGADGCDVGYRDTRITSRLRGELREVNETLASIRMEVDGVSWRGRHMVFRGIDGSESFVMPVPGNPLRRIFSRGSFDLHGRAYAWWQNVPKGSRHRITINGSPTAELDFRAMHINMLYNEAATPLPAGDAYTIPGWAREDVKLAVNIALNAATPQGSICALSQHPKFSYPNDKTKAAAVIRDARAKHHPIASAFGSDAGIRLMRRDSDVTMRALKILNKDGTPALPIHDALIVGEHHESTATEAMKQAWAELVPGPNKAEVSNKEGKTPKQAAKGQKEQQRSTAQSSEEQLREGTHSLM
jgi:hypothetical protein